MLTTPPKTRPFRPPLTTRILSTLAAAAITPVYAASTALTRYRDYRDTAARALAAECMVFSTQAELDTTRADLADAEAADQVHAELAGRLAADLQAATRTLEALDAAMRDDMLYPDAQRWIKRLRLVLDASPTVLDEAHRKRELALTSAREDVAQLRDDLARATRSLRGTQRTISDATALAAYIGGATDDAARIVLTNRLVGLLTGQEVTV